MPNFHPDTYFLVGFLKSGLSSCDFIYDYDNQDHDNDGDDDDDDDDDIYIMVKCLSRFCLFYFLPFLGTFGFRNKRKSV